MFKRKPYRLEKKYQNTKLIELCKEYDAFGFMDNKTGKELESLLDDNYAVGIHRTGLTPITEEIIADIFNNGLINNGSAMQGFFDDTFIDLTETVTFYDNILTLVSQIKYCNSYKFSQGVIIIKVPKSYIGLEKGDIKPIYFNDSGISRLLPEFIYGYIGVKDGVCSKILKNPNYTDIHTYQEDGLVYDSVGYYKNHPEANIEPFSIQTPITNKPNKK